MKNTHRQYRPGTSVRDVVASIFRQKWLILTAFVFLLVGTFLAGLWNRKYEAHMKILVVRQRFDPMVTPKAEAPVVVTGNVSEEELNSEVELLRSDDLLRKVVVKTGLTKHVRSHNDEQYSLVAAARQLALDLDIQAIHKTNVIVVHYHSPHAEDLQSVLDALATAYIEKHRDVHRSSGEFHFFEQQADLSLADLKHAEQDLVSFTQASGVVSAPLERDLTLQRLAEFDAASQKTRADIADTEHQIASLKAQIATASPRLVTEIRTGENPQVMQQLKSTLLNLELKRTELLTRFEPTYPAVQQVEEQIREARAALAKETAAPPRQETTDVDPTYAMLRTELAKAQTQLRGLQARDVAVASVVFRYRTQAQSLGEQDIQQQDLERQAKTAAENFLLYANKREEARISDALDQRGILNVAIAEKPVGGTFPMQSTAALGAIWVLVSGFGSLGMGLAVDRFSSTFRTPDEVTAYLHLPVLAALPQNATAKDSQRAGEEQSGSSESSPWGR